MTRFAIFVSTFGYLGCIPFAPGTIGSAAGLAVYAVLRLSGSARVDLGTILLLFAAGAWSGTRAEKHFGGVDPGPIIIDEVMGMLLTLFLIPVSWAGALLGFVIFRVLDVIKPYPSARLERLPGGLGVMADDAMAAVYSNLTLRLILWLGAGKVFW